MKRSELRRITPLRRGRPIKRTKPKGRARPEEPLGYCEVRSPGCTLTADHRHHKLRRSAGGDDSPENTLDVCRADHDRIHANPAWAYEHGYLIRRSA